MFTKYGTDNLLFMLGVSCVLIVLSFILSKHWVAIPLAALGILLALFAMWFFRDPDRKIPEKVKNDDSYILSPADGKIVEIKEIIENKYLKKEAIQISIFLSPLDVHVNRSPVKGLVEFYKYIPGDYLVAYHPKSSELNEHSLIGVKTNFGKVLFKQIVGIVARRLVCELKEGDSVLAGQKFGMMKFGSRMDIIVNKNTQILVKIGEKVTGGETLIGRLTKMDTVE